MIKINLPQFKELFNLSTSSNNIPNISAVYIITKNNSVVYVGTTQNLKNRIYNHRKTGDFVFYLEEEDISRQQLIEAVYKFKYLNRNKIKDGFVKHKEYSFSNHELLIAMKKITF
jgi:predicted GIY-YIG superfamily endonuclease